MKRCWLHIGMPKTGTTSIQKNLAKVENPEGWRLLTVGGVGNMGGALYAMFHPDPHEFHWFVKRGESREQVEERGIRLRTELQAAIEESGEDVCIISAEVLSIFKPNGIAALRAFLEPLVDEIRIIGYVRPPAAFNASMFQQQVKHGTNKFQIANCKPQYSTKFKKFDDLFGRENVRLRKFDPVSFPNKCIVSDFCQQIDILLPVGIPILNANESLCRQACGILYAYRKFGPGYGVGENVIKENNWLIKTLLAMHGTKLRFSKPVIDQSLEYEKDDIYWMEERLGVSLDEVINEDDSAITCEDDLLTISRKACEEYAARFKEFYDVDLPLEAIPQQDPIDPRLVANLVENSRVLSSQIRRDKRRQATEIAKSANKKWVRKTWFWRFKRFTMRRLTRLFGTGSSR